MMEAARARRANARQAMNLMHDSLRAYFGDNKAPLRACQVLCFGAASSTPIIWRSKIINAERLTGHELSRLIMPFIMSQEVDEVPGELEGSAPELEDEETVYMGFALRLYSADAMAANVPGKHHNFSVVLRSLFQAADPKCTWVVDTSNRSLIQQYEDKQEGLERMERNTHNLFWFQQRMANYLLRNGLRWKDIWPSQAELSTFVTAHEWRAKFADSSTALNLERHMRRGLPPNATFHNLARKLYKQIYNPRQNRVAPLPYTAANQNFPRLAMDQNVSNSMSSAPPELLAKAALLSPIAWRGRRPFRSGAAIREWVLENSGLYDREGKIHVIPADISSWPMWPFILVYPPTLKERYDNFEFRDIASKVLSAILERPDKVVQFPKANKALMEFRTLWLNANNFNRKLDMRQALPKLTTALREYTSHN